MMAHRRTILVAVLVATSACIVEGVRDEAVDGNELGVVVTPHGRLSETAAPASDDQEMSEMAKIRLAHLDAAARGQDLEDYGLAVEQNKVGSLVEVGDLAEVSKPTTCYWKGSGWETLLNSACELLGKGSFGAVWEGSLRCSPSTKVAVKVMRKVHRDEFSLEVDLLKKFSGHPSFVAYVGHNPKNSSTETIAKGRIMMEAATGGTLGSVIADKNVGENDRKQLFFDMVAGIAHMHDQKTVHRDLKPANVFVSVKCHSKKEKCHAKVGDLGLSCNMEKKGDCSGIAGTPYYLAPEVLKKEYVSYDNDVWALGLMLYELLFRQLPDKLEHTSSQGQLFKAIQQMDIEQDKNFKKLSSFGKLLIKGMLQQSPVKRMTAQEALEVTALWIRLDKLQSPRDFTLPDCIHKQGADSFGVKEASTQLAYYKKQLKQVVAKIESVGSPEEKEQKMETDILDETIKSDVNLNPTFQIVLDPSLETGSSCCRMLMDPALEAISPHGRVRTIHQSMIAKCDTLKELKHNAYILRVNGMAYQDMQKDICSQKEEEEEVIFECLNP